MARWNLPCAKQAGGLRYGRPEVCATIITLTALFMDIQCYSDRSIGEQQFIDLLRRSTLAERRPVDDPQCIQAMLRHADLLCTAWDGARLVGVARSVTDFEYCCYLSDLAVDEAYQKRGIGRKLIELTQSKLGKRANLILLAAPKAADYYPKIGFDAHRSAWILPPGKRVR